MKDQTYRTLDDKDLAFIDLLISVGVPHNVASLIAFLRSVPEASSKEIEMTTGLRQPEVSVGMTALRTLGWITEREIKPEGKGRPTKVYSLTVTADEIIRHYEEEMKAEAEATRDAFNRLKEMAAGVKRVAVM